MNMDDYYNSDLYRYLAENGVGLYGYPHQELMQQSFCSNSSSSYYPFDVSRITDTTNTPQNRALAALKNHKEAEKRRRQRINSHLDKLRTILPCDFKVFFILLYRLDSLLPSFSFRGTRKRSGILFVWIRLNINSLLFEALEKESTSELLGFFVFRESRQPFTTFFKIFLNNR